MARISERLSAVARELAEICLSGPAEINRQELAKMGARISAVAGQVALGERSIIVCPNCDADLPEGCDGVFRNEGESCWLNRSQLPTSEPGRGSNT